jgi:hypothetical protein
LNVNTRHTLRKNLIYSIPDTCFYSPDIDAQNGWWFEISTSGFIAKEWATKYVTRVYDSQVLQIYPWLSVTKIVIINAVL